MIGKAKTERYDFFRILGFERGLETIQESLTLLENDLLQFLRIEELKRKKGIKPETENSFIVIDEISNPTNVIISNEKNHLKELKEANEND